MTKKKYYSGLQAVSALLIISLIFTSTAFSQMIPGTRADVDRINQSVDNGIFVDTAKVYDDSSLQLMLNAARIRLATLQSFDQTGLLSRIGAITGASLQQQSISAQILGPPLPSTAVSALGATGTTTTVNAPTGQTVTSVAGQPVQNVTTTTPQMSATAPTLPQNSVSLPTSGFNVSSLDALNEMMQLTYEIANLQLLLEGSLSDRYVSGNRIIKPRTTLGFPVTIMPQTRYKDAVAIVEIEVINPNVGTFSNEQPTVTALLPREKTYNVASITDNMTSVGGGVVTQVLSGGFSFLRGRKSYYIVQDQDTLAMVQKTTTPNATSFSWQFRPVLGQHYVRGGLKQTFVQLAAPLMAQAGCFGNLKITTYWRKYDRKRGVIKEVIEDSIRVDTAYRPIPRFDTTPVIENVGFRDLGSGVVQASLTGRFLPGTYIRIGNNFYREGSPGFTSELTQIRFIANASDVAKQKAFLVSRDGTETEIVDASSPILLPALPPGCGLIAAPVQPVIVPPTIAPQITTYDNSNSVLEVDISQFPVGSPGIEQYVIVVGNKVFGLSDAPIERSFNSATNTGKLKAIVSNSMLNSATNIEVKPLFWREEFSAKFTDLYKAENSSDKIIPYEQAANGDTLYLLYGSRLQSAQILVPGGVALNQFNNYTNTDTLRSFQLTANQAKGKQIVLLKSSGERPIILSLPALADADKKPVLTVKGGLPVPVGAREIIIVGDSLDKIKAVTLNGNIIDFKLAKDKKSIILTGAGITDDFSDKELLFEFEGDVKSTLKLEFANNKNKVTIVVPN